MVTTPIATINRIALQLHLDLIDAPPLKAGSSEVYPAPILASEGDILEEAPDRAPSNAKGVSRSIPLEPSFRPGGSVFVVETGEAPLQAFSTERGFQLGD